MDNLNKPFPSLNIDDYSKLFEIESRFKCPSCKKMRKYFCYKCSVPHDLAAVPSVKLPFKIDIIKHRQEVDGKSTSCHARMIANDDVKIYEYPEIPNYEGEEGIFLLFVSPKAVDVNSLFKGIKKLKLKENYGLSKGHLIGTLLTKNLKEIIEEEQDEQYVNDEIYTLENLPIKKAVLIDSTWKQCRGIYLDQRIQSLNTLIIQNRITKFWRKQKGAPDWFLSTIEAMHQLLFEFHVNAWGISKSYYENCLNDYQFISKDFIPQHKIVESKEDSQLEKNIDRPYNGQYDNLLFFFSFMYSLIHSLSDPNECLPNLKQQK